MGKSRAGSRSTPSLVQETSPTTSSAPITISMNNGRRMAMFVRDIQLALPTFRSRSARERDACFDLRRDNVAVRQVVQAAGSYQLADVDTTGNLDHALALQTQLDGLAMHSAGRIDGDHERLGARRADQDRFARHDQGVLLLGSDDSEAGEHARTQVAALISWLDPPRRPAGLCVHPPRGRTDGARGRFGRERLHFQP